MKRATLAAIACAIVAPTAAAAPAVAADPLDRLSQRSQDIVTVAGIKRHLREFQNIAERNGGTRASGTRGHERSAAYVMDRLRAAGWRVEQQPFDFDFFQKTGPSTLTAGGKTYTEAAENGSDGDYTVMSYSGSGTASGKLVPVDVMVPPGETANSSSSGCEASDFEGFPSGAVALVQRGTCPFGTKVDNAVAAGASAVIIFNEGQAGRTDVIAGTLGGPKPVPVLATSYAVGAELAGLPGDATATVTTNTVSETRKTSNVLASSRGGDPTRTVVIGSHLDSVAEGPGINDNGSGSAMNLEMAEELARVVRNPANKIVVAFWGAEEQGLIGSTKYVESLSQDQKDNIMANLNFDMVASPNYARFVYDGDGSMNPEAGAGPIGSDVIEQTFEKHFASKGLATQPTAFDGRSDYGPFIEQGIPAGGLFSGAEGVKTEEQASLFGGTAGQPFDACYHKACDNIRNINDTALDEFSNAAVDASVRLAMRKVPLTDNEVAMRRAAKIETAADDMNYKGNELAR